MSKQEQINYLEFPSTDIAVTKAFFETTFAWKFTDYGPEYSAFSGAGIDGGFYASKLVMSTKNGSALVVLLSEDLEATQRKIESAGGGIIQKIFSFPGGRRFHFTDPNGNEYAVWATE
jgi:uncharacterized protein